MKASLCNIICAEDEPTSSKDDVVEAQGTQEQERHSSFVVIPTALSDDEESRIHQDENQMINSIQIKDTKKKNPKHMHTISYKWAHFGSGGTTEKCPPPPPPMTTITFWSASNKNSQESTTSNCSTTSYGGCQYYYEHSSVSSDISFLTQKIRTIYNIKNVFRCFLDLSGIPPSSP